MESNQVRAIALFEKGYTDEQVAAELYVCLPTVKRYRSLLYEKHGVINQAGFAAKRISELVKENQLLNTRLRGIERELEIRRQMSRAPSDRAASQRVTPIHGREKTCY